MTMPAPQENLPFDRNPDDGLAHDDEPCCAEPAPPIASCNTACCGQDAQPAKVTLGKAAAKGGYTQTPIRIMQMDCPTEEALLRKRLGGMAGVSGMEFNLMQRVLTVSHEPQAIDLILEAVRSLGFTPEVVTGASSEAVGTPEPAEPWWPLALAGVAAIGSEAAVWLGLPTWLPALLALAAVLACGIGTYKKGWVAIRHGDLNINALMSIAVTGALVLGQWAEAAMVMVLFTVAELIEAKSLDRARNAIKGLIQLAPERASVLQDDGSWQDVEAKSVAIQARVRVKPGERIALDGTVVSGRSTVNQAPITGESLPVDKAQGDAVFAGTINESGSFEYLVTAAAGDSTLARIIHAVEEAQGARAPTQRFVDQFARVYTPAVFAVALVVAILPPLLMGAAWFDWVYKALVLLVIACPCALVISTPVTIVSGLAAAARQGILIKGGVYLEEGRKLVWLALDKTGTITHGKPVQTDFVVLNGHNEADVRSLAASLASRSDHPVSRAVATAAQREGIALQNVEGFEALPGRGVKGLIDGKLCYLGNHRLIHEQGRCSLELEARLSALEEQGKTVILLSDEQSVQGLFAVADTVKDSSRQAIAELHALGIKTVMLTGDNAHTARAIAEKVGIDEAQGDLLPEDKLRAIEGKIGQGGSVGMVGDGINDAPALARADIGFAMGAAGTGTAIETADVALMDDDLRKLPRFVRLSRHTHVLLVQNIALALGIKAVFLVLTLIGLGTMWMAVFADVGASLLVVGNGLRLLRAPISR
ncbi:MAG: heavy metal translocating P-type ATPase [Aquabacterium sp.]|nr:heavy metal translocating P-type ATPase [Aquabacterium sp.]